MSNKLPKGNQINTNDIIIDDGSRAYNIKNKRGEILGKFIFIPSDMNIIDRYKHAVETFDKLQDKIKNESEDADVIKLKNECEKEIEKEIDYLFRADASGTFFTITTPFTPLESGELFVESVLNAVRLIIEKETGKRLERAKSRASKYTERYHK